MRVSLHILGIVMACYFAFLPAWAAAEIYRWTDRSGKVHYSTTPPNNATGAVEVKRNNQWMPYGGDAQGQTDSSPITYTTSSPGENMSPAPVSSPQAGPIIIPYKQSRDAIIVDVTINGRVTKPFVVDTGASYMVIATSIADELYLSPNSSGQKITLQTANGRVSAPLINLDSVQVGSLAAPNVVAAVHDFDESKTVYGLLGLSFLSRFQMTVDAQQHQLIFTPITAPNNYASQNCVTALNLVKKGQQLRDFSEQEAACYQRAIKLCPDLVDSYYHLGAIYIHQNNAEQALAIHQKIVKMQPDEAEAHFRLGVAYILNRRVEEAERALQAALRLNPNHAQAAEYLQRLKSQ